jgi:hypothetical protein
MSGRKDHRSAYEIIGSIVFNAVRHAVASVRNGNAEWNAGQSRVHEAGD